MTKEEILDKAHSDLVVEQGISSIHTKDFPAAYQQQAVNAMEEYAKQEQFKLAEFIDDNHFRRNKSTGMWFDNNFNFLTPEQLYNLYLQSKK